MASDEVRSHIIEGEYEVYQHTFIYLKHTHFRHETPAIKVALIDK